VPSTDYQLSVINHLKKIDDKITLNRQINQTLEQMMAQALFKSWFVDFDPVVDNALDAGFFEQDLALPDELLRRAEARRAEREHGDFKPLPDATRQLFPAAFEECAEPSLGLGGWVPKGWVAATFSDLADVVMGQSPKGDAYNSNGIGTPLINGPVEFGEYHPVKSKWTTSTTKMSEKNDLIVCVRGSTTGRYVISDGEYCLGRGVCAVRGGLIQPFITYQFKSNITTLLGLATGSTFPSWSGPLLKKHIVLKPSAGPIKKFCAIAGSNLKKMGDLDVENLALSELRETLLPKLISGELSLDQIESDLTKEGMA
jgi:type I restriction enzyme S subunit